MSSDKRDVDNAAAEGNERAQLAKDMLVYQIKKYIGGYAAAMGGLDCVVFCGGIGENDNDLRAAVCDKMEVLGIGAINKEQNNKRGLDINDITGEGSKVKVLAICTNEELMIARDTEFSVHFRGGLFALTGTAVLEFFQSSGAFLIL